MPVTRDYSGAPHAAALRRWLVACVVAVFLAVVVGGITRLTESGLSITEWKPVSGVFPPTTDDAWAEAFAAFQRIPQAQTTHAGITLGEFKFIYWWEWFHRIVARGVGLVFLVPFAWYLARGRIPAGLRLRLASLPVLTLAQGALGWYMVQSGLAERSSVSAYRLTAHLTLALAILVVALWSWADLRPVPGADVRAAAGGARREPEESAAGRALAAARWRTLALVAVTLVAVTIASGGFVAGLRAGKIYNTFPLMGGEVVPPGYAQLGTGLRNAAENPIAAQFHHRVLAIVTGLFALALAARAGASGLSAPTVRALRAMGLVVLLQVALGIITLLTAVPVALGALHQLVGVAALTAGVLALHATTRERALHGR